MGKSSAGARGTSSKTDWANVCLKIEQDKALKLSNPKMSQKAMADELGISAGKVNSLLKRSKK